MTWHWASYFCFFKTVVVTFCFLAVKIVFSSVIFSLRFLKKKTLYWIVSNFLSYFEENKMFKSYLLFRSNVFHIYQWKTFIWSIWNNIKSQGHIEWLTHSLIRVFKNFLMFIHKLYFPSDHFGEKTWIVVMWWVKFWIIEELKIVLKKLVLPMFQWLDYCRPKLV